MQADFHNLANLRRINDHFSLEYLKDSGKSLYNHKMHTKRGQLVKYIMQHTCFSWKCFVFLTVACKYIKYKSWLIYIDDGSHKTLITKTVCLEKYPSKLMKNIYTYIKEAKQSSKYKMEVLYETQI